MERVGGEKVCFNVLGHLLCFEIFTISSPLLTKTRCGFLQ